MSNKVSHYMLKFFQNPAFFLQLEHDWTYAASKCTVVKCVWQATSNLAYKQPNRLIDSLIPLALYRVFVQSVVTMAMEIKLWNGWYHTCTWLVITTLAAKHCCGCLHTLVSLSAWTKILLWTSPPKTVLWFGPNWGNNCTAVQWNPSIQTPEMRTLIHSPKMSLSQYEINLWNEDSSLIMKNQWTTSP